MVPAHALELPSDPATFQVPGSSETIRVNFRELQKGDVSQNVMLRHGDLVFLMKAETAYVFGQVRSPGAYPLQPNMTVVQVLALAGGVSPNAAMNRMRIERVMNGSRQQIRVQLSDPVRPGDTIVVPERFF
jgi:polysaccharide export outer membrane protein